jgi:hypothetical protein
MLIQFDMHSGGWLTLQLFQAPTDAEVAEQYGLDEEE